MKNNLFLTTIVFFCFLTNVYAENGHVGLKYLSENYSSFGQTQNLSGFGVELYNKFIKESDGENYVNYIEKSLLLNPVNIWTYRNFTGIFWKVQKGRMVPRAGLEPAQDTRVFLLISAT